MESHHSEIQILLKQNFNFHMNGKGRSLLSAGPVGG